MFADRIFGRAAEAWILLSSSRFSLPSSSASSILGLVARSAHLFYDRILDYLALVIPTAALGAVLRTFNETAAAASSGKLTFGLIAAIWSASVGISAVQDTLNDVYKVKDSRSYFFARICAIAPHCHRPYCHRHHRPRVLARGRLPRCVGSSHYPPGPACRCGRHHLKADRLACGNRVPYLGLRRRLLLGAQRQSPVLALAHARRRRGYRRLAALLPGSPASTSIIFPQLLSYLRFPRARSSFLLTWFYITGLMLLLGAEINSEIEGAAAEMRLAAIQN